MKMVVGSGLRKRRKSATIDRRGDDIAIAGVTEREERDVMANVRERRDCCWGEKRLL